MRLGHDADVAAIPTHLPHRGTKSTPLPARSSATMVPPQSSSAAVTHPIWSLTGVKRPNKFGQTAVGTCAGSASLASGGGFAAGRQKNDSCFAASGVLAFGVLGQGV